MDIHTTTILNDQNTSSSLFSRRKEFWDHLKNGDWASEGLTLEGDFPAPQVISGARWDTCTSLDQINYVKGKHWGQGWKVTKWLGLLGTALSISMATFTSGDNHRRNVREKSEHYILAQLGTSWSFFKADPSETVMPVPYLADQYEETRVFVKEFLYLFKQFTK